eukprot:Phypoly_transcript_01860.p1 GENE.Phypoly_transcript_01860~~Phypoly_transcript_01860.p1  ORF type:complete len:848 (+),score=78.93 Phypoly_transcript_01860:133-2676(+)
MLSFKKDEKETLIESTITYGTENVKLSINEPAISSASTSALKIPSFFKSSIFHHLLVNGTILSIFIGLYELRNNAVWYHHVPYVFASGCFYLLSFFALVSCFRCQHSLQSSFVTLFFCASRGTEFLLPVVFTKSSNWLPHVLMIQGAVEYVLNVHAVAQIPREYILSWKANNRRKARTETDFYEKIEGKARFFVVASCGAMVMLGVYAIKFPGLWIPVGSKMSQMVSIVSGFIIVFCSIFRVQTETRKGFELHSRAHSNGLVLALLLVGMVVRLVIDSILLLIGIPLQEYLPNVGLDGYQGSAKELSTMGVPLAMHFFNINSKSSNSSRRARMSFYLCLVIFGTLVASYVISAFSHECDLDLGKTCVKPFTIFLARIGALMGTLFINLTILCILTPISQLLYSFLNLGVLHHAIEKLHFHRDMAFNAIFFFVLHICAHAYTWITIPNISYHGVKLYAVTNTSFVTGIVMLSGFLVATFSGIFPSFFRFHIIAVLVACMAFMFHGYQHILGPALGDYATLTVIIIVVLLVCFFSFTTPVLHLEVMQEECRVTGERQGKRLLLVLKYENLGGIHPGAYYNIYNSSASWQLFHGHPFTVFSTRPDRICFLIAVRQENSFTDRLCKKVMTAIPSASISTLSISGKRFKPCMLYLRGPFLSPAKALVEYIEQHRTTPVELFICGSGTGVTSASSLADLFLSKQALFPKLSVKVVCDINTCGWMQEGKDENEKGRNAQFLTKFNEMSGLALTLNTVRRRKGKSQEEARKKLLYTQTKGKMVFYHLVDQDEPTQNTHGITEEISDTLIADSISGALALAEKQDPEVIKVLFYCGRSLHIGERFSSWIVFTETSD